MLKIISATAVPLAQVGIDFKILGVQIDSLFASIAASAKPIIEEFVNSMTSLVQVLRNSNFLQDLIKSFVKLGEVIGIIVSSNALLDQMIKNTFDILTASLSNLYQNVMHPISGGDQIDTDEMKNASDIQLGDMAEALKNQWAKLFGKGTGGSTTLPNPQSFMQQLPASTWEKMGLTVGGGQNQQLQIAKESRNYLRTIAATLTANKPSGTAFQFGMNPLTSNP